MTPDELTEVERIVNEKIVENRPVHIFVTERETARQLGAMMLFGEKYGEHVRVVEIPEFSSELCGGTHVRSTAEIGAFVLQREASSSQGVRRIEAIAGRSRSTTCASGRPRRTASRARWPSCARRSRSAAVGRRRRRLAATAASRPCSSRPARRAASAS